MNYSGLFLCRKYHMPYIYESPDGGKTVFARKFGEKERYKAHESDDIKNQREQLAENELWYKIRKAALTNTTLACALNQVKVIYELSRKNEN